MYCVCSALDLSLYLPRLSLLFSVLYSKFRFIFFAFLSSLVYRIQYTIALNFIIFVLFRIYLTCFSSVLASFYIWWRERSAPCYNISLCTCLSHSFLKSYFVTTVYLYISSPSPSLRQQYPSARLRQPNQFQTFHKTNAYFHLVVRRWCWFGLAFLPLQLFGPIQINPHTLARSSVLLAYISVFLPFLCHCCYCYYLFSDVLCGEIYISIWFKR